MKSIVTWYCCRFILALVIMQIGSCVQASAQQTETLTTNSTLSIDRISINNINIDTIQVSVSKFFEISARAFQPDSLKNFFQSLILPFADTSKAEYAGMYMHFNFGGNLSGFEQNLSLYPNLRNVPTPLEIRTFTSEFRTFTLGLATDTPILFPFFKSRKKAKATGFRWGMNLDAQITDARLLGGSSAARFALSNGAIERTSADVRHGGFLSAVSLAFTPTLRYAFSSGLSLQAGLRLSLTVGSSWTVEDSIFFPQRGALLWQTNAGRFSETLRGQQIPGLQVSPTSLILGIGYAPIADRSVQIRPEIILDIPLGVPVGVPVGSRSWAHKTSLRAGVSILLNTEKYIPTPDTTFIRDTTVIVVASNEAPQMRLLRTNSIVEPSLYPNDEPAKVFVSEHYERRVPKPKPLLNASVDAEFILPNGQRKHNVTVEAEKTAVSVLVVGVNDSAGLEIKRNLSDEMAARRYFSAANLNLQSIESVISIPAKRSIDAGKSEVPSEINRRPLAQSSSGNLTLRLLTDTLLLASALPQIAFTPRVVSEVDLRGFELSLWRYLQGNTGFEKHFLERPMRQIALLRDTSAALVPKPFLWKPAEATELFIRPEERIVYRFAVIDEENTKFPVDSGFISLRADIRGNPLAQACRRFITIFALNPTLLERFEAEKELLEEIFTFPNQHYTQIPRRIRVISSLSECGGAEAKNKCEETINFLRRLRGLSPLLASAGVEFASCPENQTQTGNQEMLFVILER